MEVLLRDFSMRTFTPVVIAAVAAVACTQGMLGNNALFARSGGFSREAFSNVELPNYLIMGVCAGLAAAAFIRALSLTERVFDRLRVPVIAKPAVGAALLGGVGLAWIVLTRSPRGMPEFYGSGYPMVRDLLTPAFYYQPQGQTLQPPSLLLLIALIGLIKALATCLTIGSGGSGGLFAPSLLMGAALGGAFGYVINSLGWLPSATPAHYALVGMAAVLAAAAHAPLTGILLVYELTQNYAIILPLMLATVISTIVARFVHPDSVYTAKLTDMGVRIGALSDLTILRRLSVHDVALTAVVTVQQDDSAQDLIRLSETHLVRDFVVVDTANRYMGMVTGTDLAAALVYREAIPLLTVRELVRSDVPTVTSDETLDLVLEKFSRMDIQSLAVLRDGGSRQVQALITRSHLMERYQTMLRARH